jgi:hypothetical protein
LTAQSPGRYRVDVQSAQRRLEIHE